MEIDFNRFVSSQRYCSTVPLEELELKVVISRALTVEEDHIETVMETIIPWNAKLYSPTEQIDMWNKLRRRSNEGEFRGGPSQQKEKKQRGLSEPRISTLSSSSQLGNHNPPQEGRSAENMKCPCPSPRQLLHHLSQPSTWLFTHPSEEDYIDVKQEECPVLPPQGASLLAPIILRRHRQEHLPSNHFYLVWADGMTTAMTRQRASGKIVARPPTTGPIIPVARDSESAMVPSSLETSISGGDQTTKSLLSGETQDEDPEEIVNVEWSGQELVFCTIVMEPDGAYFTAKPTLGEEHTLRVDASHIYRFRVDVQHRRARLEGIPSTSTEGETKEGHTPTAAASVSRGATGMLIQDQRGTGPSVVLPSALSVFASAVHDKLVAGKAEIPRRIEEEPGAPTSVMSPVPGGLTPGRSKGSAMPMSRELLKAVAQTIPRGASSAHHEHQAAARESARRRAFAGDTSYNAATAAAIGATVEADSLELSGHQHKSSATTGGVHSAGNSYTGTGRAVRFGLSPTRPPIMAARTHYYVFGVVERCVGVSESTLFARCELYRDRASSAERSFSPSVPISHREEESPSFSGKTVRGGSGGGEGSSQGSSVTGSHPFCTQLAHMGTVVELDYAVVEPEHVFNCPFEYHYEEYGQCPLQLKDDVGSSESPLQGIPPSPLRMAIGLYTEGYDAVGIQSAVGYACVTLPILSPGTHQLRCPIWSIHKTGAETLRSSLVGGAPSFVDLRQAGPFPQDAGLLSPSMYMERGNYWNAQAGSGIGVKQSLVTESLGNLYLTVNILVQKDAAA